MEAQIIIDKEGNRWFLVEKERIRIRVYLSEKPGELKMVAVRVGKDPSRDRFLQENFSFTSKFEISDEIVRYAVRKEQSQSEAIKKALEKPKRSLLAFFAGHRAQPDLKDIRDVLGTESYETHFMEQRLSADLLKSLPGGGGLN